MVYCLVTILLKWQSLWLTLCKSSYQHIRVSCMVADLVSGLCSKSLQKTAVDSCKYESVSEFHHHIFDYNYSISSIGPTYHLPITENIKALLYYTKNLCL